MTNELKMNGMQELNEKEMMAVDGGFLPAVWVAFAIYLLVFEKHPS